MILDLRALMVRQHSAEVGSWQIPARKEVSMGSNVGLEAGARETITSYEKPALQEH